MVDSKLLTNLITFRLQIVQTFSRGKPKTELVHDL